MNRWIKRMAAVVFSAVAAVMFCTAAAADTYITKDYSSTDFITQEQFDMILQTLRNCSAEDTSGDVSAGHFTGISCSAEEAEKIIHAFEDLYMGTNSIGINFSPDGVTATYEDVYIDPNMKEYSFVTIANKSMPGGIYVGWLSGSDAPESLRQHDEAAAKLKSILSSAPRDDRGFYKYMLNWLCRNVTYNYSSALYSNSPYAAIVKGSAICSGYSRTLMAACFMTGRKCYCVSSTLDNMLHSSNVVIYKGTPKWVDATNADQDWGIDESFFLYDLNDEWYRYLFEEPFFQMTD